MNKRTAREINVPKDLLINKSINVKIGTVENRNCPETVYIYISFWLDPQKCDKKVVPYLKHKLNAFFKNIYNKKFIEKYIIPNEFFTSEKDNIFIYNIPENFNYSNKPSFMSIELYLHTVNLEKKKYPLNAKKDTELFNECLKIGNKIGEKVNLLKKEYKIEGVQKKVLI
jgi:hypothetical protein